MLFRSLGCPALPGPWRSATRQLLRPLFSPSVSRRCGGHTWLLPGTKGKAGGRCEVSWEKWPPVRPNRPEGQSCPAGHPPLLCASGLVFTLPRPFRKRTADCRITRITALGFQVHGDSEKLLGGERGFRIAQRRVPVREAQRSRASVGGTTSRGAGTEERRGTPSRDHDRVATNSRWPEGIWQRLLSQTACSTCHSARDNAGEAARPLQSTSAIRPA